MARPLSIASRLASFAVVFVTASVVAASIILYLILATVVRQQIDQQLDTQIEGVRNALTVADGGKIVLATPFNAPPFDRPGTGWSWQVTGDGVDIGSPSLSGQSMDLPPPAFDWHQALSGRPQPLGRIGYGGKILYVRELWTSLDNHTIRIAASAPQDALTRPATRALFWLVPAMALLGLVLVVGILLQVRYGLRPLKQLTADIAAIASGRLARLPDADVKELQPAAEAINRLVDENARRLAETRLHFANLAHGLKTPVASLSLALNEVPDPDRTLHALVERIDQRIRHHLARARQTTASGVSLAVPIKPRIDDLVLVMSRIHADRNIAVRTDLGLDLAVACESSDFDEILGNLIENAFKWTRSTVEIDAAIVDRAIRITIEDDGPGMSEEAIASAFLPGVRLDETVPGDGFGLTIASDIVQLYGGTITLTNSTRGLRQIVTIPRAIS